MPHLTLPLSPAGCLFDLFVGVSRQRQVALNAAKQTIPTPILIRGMIDTGASGTAIDENAIKPLGLTPTGSTQIHTPSTRGTAATCPTYDVAVGIYHSVSPLLIATVPVIASDFTGMGFDALVGRDVLQRCLFLYDGVAGTFTIGF